MARDAHASSDYGAPAVRSNTMHRPLIAVTHALHLISSVIVMSIAAYFVHNFARNTHLVYWVSIAAIDSLLYLPAVALPSLKSYKGYLAPLAWIFSYLWLTAFIFAVQDYEYGACSFHSPAFVNKCSLKKTLEAFAFISFFTSLAGTLLESRLWDKQRFKGAQHSNTVDAEKHHVAPVAETTAGSTHPTASVA